MEKQNNDSEKGKNVNESESSSMVGNSVIHQSNKETNVGSDKFALELFPDSRLPKIPNFSSSNKPGNSSSTKQTKERLAYAAPTPYESFQNIIEGSVAKSRIEYAPEVNENKNTGSKRKTRLEYAAPLGIPNINRVVNESVIHSTPGAINIIPGNQPERRVLGAVNRLFSHIDNVSENEFNQEIVLSSGNDYTSSTPELMTIANANLVKPEEEEARIINKYVNTVAQATVVEKNVEENGSLCNKKRTIFYLIAFIILVSLALVSIFAFSGREPTNEKEPTKKEKLLRIFKSVTDENQLLEDGSPQSTALSYLISDDIFVNNMTDALLLEHYIALVFYFSTEGQYWNDDLNFIQNTSVCKWWKEDVGGFECNQKKEIVSITAVNNNLTGTLSSEIFRLPSLERIELKSNMLHGTIPSIVSELDNLAILDLSQNSLTGVVPDIYMESKTMRYLNLGDNNLNGGIPEFQRLLGYIEIHLNRNELTGNIPESISVLSSLKVLDFRDNSLNGTIPTGISTMESLERILLNGNNLSGSIPHQVKNLRDLRMLYMGNNILTGTIPRNIASLDKLNDINLHGNKLTGSIPTELATLENLWSLGLSGNKLTGTFPKEFSSSKVLLHVDISANFISGALDKDFCSEVNQHEFHIAADCWGVAPRVQCSCCKQCYNDDGYYLMNDSSICSYEWFAEKLMQENIKQGVSCNCDEAGQSLRCTFSPQNPCEVCNIAESTCIRINDITYEFDSTKNLFFSVNMQYIKGGNNSISVGISNREYCSIAVDGKKCESCKLQNCGQNSQRVPLISCKNNDEINNVFDACNKNIGTDDAGIFEALVWIIKNNLVSEDVPYIFDLNSLFTAF